MHYATHIVVLAEMRNVVRFVLIEIVLFTILDVFPGNVNIVLAFVRTLHVIETEGMQEFMNNGPLVNASI